MVLFYNILNYLSPFEKPFTNPPSQDCNLFIIYKSFDNFIDWRNSIRENYKKIFGTRIEYDINGNTKEEIETEAEVKTDPFTWVRFIDTMTSGNILAHEDFFKLNWLYVLNVQTMRLIDQEEEFKKNK